jgi:hypothetical protein
MDINIKEELKELESDSFGYNAIKKVKIQHEEVFAKLHLLKSISVANQIEKVASTDLFFKVGVEFLQLSINYEDFEKGPTIEFYLLDEDHKRVISYYDASMNEQARVMYTIFDQFGEFDLDLVGHDFKKQIYFNIDLSVNTKEAILNVLLNDELKKIYEYNKMQTEIPEKNEINSKKMKV